jgi:hydrogenase maturation protease
LGPALVEALEERQIAGLTLDSNYQLTVEDSSAVAEHEVVIFADADASGPEPFSLRPARAVRGLEYSSHGVEPPAVLALAEEIFGRKPEAYLFGIRGYEFNMLAEGLSEKARQNLASAIEFIVPLLQSQSFEKACLAR